MRNTSEWKWFRSPASGRYLSKEDFQGWPIEAQAALWELIVRFRRGEHRSGEVRKVDGDISELRVRLAGNAYRALYFHDGSNYYICVTVYHKKSQKLPKSVLATARSRMTAWKDEGKRRREAEASDDEPQPGR